MIENIRNYYGLMMVVLVALFLSFLFTGFSGSKGAMGASGDAVYRIDGTTYGRGDFQKLGTDSQKLAGGMGMYEFLSGLDGFSDRPEGTEKFFINRVLIRQAAEQFGIHPGHDEITAYLENLQAFADRTTGKYSKVAYRNFIEKVIGRYGMTEADLMDMANDAIVVRKLGEIVGGGLGASPKIIGESSALSRQMVTTQVAKIPLDSFKEAIKPTDAEVEAYWKDIQDAFKTDAQRKFTYFIATPKPVGVKPADEPKPEDKKPEDADKPAKPDPTKDDPKMIEERRKNDEALSAQVTAFIEALQESKGSKFEELAKEQGFDVKTTGLFTLATAPPELAVMIREGKNARPSTRRAADMLFQVTVTSDPYSKISDTLPIGDNQWLVARLDEEVPSRTKTFDEAKEQAKAQVHRRKSP